MHFLYGVAKGQGQKLFPSDAGMANSDARQRALFGAGAAACAAALALVAVASWAASAGRGDALLQRGQRGGRIAAALHTALREDGRVQELQGEVRSLDTIRDGMLRQLAHQPREQLRLGGLADVVQETRQLQAKLDAAASAEKRLLLQSEEIVDGGCKDHHAESCGSESCCTFWAKAGQCLASSEHREWMKVRCAKSCGSCRADGAAAAATAAAPPSAHELQHARTHPARKKTHVSNAAAAAARLAKRRALKNKMALRSTGLAWPPAGGMKQVAVSMVLHGLDTSKLSHAELEQALHRAVESLSPRGLSPQVVKLDSVQPITGAAAELHTDRPIRRRRWVHPQRSRTVEFVHGTRPEQTTEEEVLHEPRQPRTRDEEQGDSFAPRRRLLSTEALAEVGPAHTTAVRVKFHVSVPAGLKGERMVDALRAAVREEVHKELVRSKLAHPSTVRVALEHVAAPKEVHDTAYSRFGSLLGSRPYHTPEQDLAQGRPVQESGLGGVGSPVEEEGPHGDMLGEVLSGGGAYRDIPGAADGREVASAGAEQSFAQWFDGFRGKETSRS